MFIKKIHLKKYKVLEDISINFEPKQDHNVFPIISINGGGKSTLLQVLFCFLHCAFKEERHQYLQHLLESFEVDTNENTFSSFIEFELIHKKQLVKLHFFGAESESKEFNFNAILELKAVRKKIKANQKVIEQIELLSSLENDLKKSKIPSRLIWHELQAFAEHRKQMEALESGGFRYQLDFIEKTKRKIENSLIADKELNALLIQTNAERKKLIKQLEERKLNYAFHFKNNSKVLLYESNAGSKILTKISNYVHLAIPNTQVLHFLDKKKLSSLFSNDDYIYSNYQYYIKKCQKEVSGLFTYDFAAIQLILEAFKKARDEDFKAAIETGQYGNQINATRNELNTLLANKSITIDKDFKGVTFTSDNSNKTLSPKDLSHGELKKLSIYIWLKAKTRDDSVIFMDEVETGLHPAWQHDLYNDLQKWTRGNQFILATHSPQIISKSYYKNLAVLKKTEQGVSSQQFTEAPLEGDLNTIVKTIMGGEYIPKELTILRKKYRQFFENNQLGTKEARQTKEAILIYESENSSFFQDIKFQMELRK